MQSGANDADEQVVLEIQQNNYRNSERIFDPNYEVDDETRKRVSTFYRNIKTKDFGKDLDALFDANEQTSGIRNSTMFMGQKIDEDGWKLDASNGLSYQKMIYTKNMRQVRKVIEDKQTNNRKSILELAERTKFEKYPICSTPTGWFCSCKCKACCEIQLSEI